MGTNDFTEEEKKSIKSIESLLIAYPKTEHRIEKMEIEIEIIEHDYETLKGQSDNKIKASTRTNETHDLSDNMMNKETRIVNLKDKIFKEKMTARMIKNAMSSLSEEDRKFISDRYFERMSPKLMAGAYYCTETWIFIRSRLIIKDKLMQYIDVI